MKKVIFLSIITLFCIACNESESPTENIIEQENHITANYKFGAVEAYIKSEDKDLDLKNIMSNSIDNNGFSKSWCYRYSKILDSAFTSKYYYISSFYDSICCDSITIGATTVGDAFISQNWLNSDKIMGIAENNGGKEFRINNSSYNIYASLSEAVVPNSKPIWDIKYTSKINESISLNLRIDAVSGTIE